MKKPGRFTSKQLFICLLLAASLPVCSHAADNDFFELDLSTLMQIQLTTAGRKEQNLAKVPAAAYVIDQEDIRNSGATSIPELLRMVPGLQVARITSSKWAVTARGFNGSFANKLLVQIDGRSVYTPTYSGVYWDVQNIMLEDIDRIEVVRGPGATLWGANAVNGIINIITKQASDTQGGVISLGSGNHEKALGAFRHGLQLNKDLYARYHIAHHERDSFRLLDEKSDAYDDWSTTYGGFRLDGDTGLDNVWTFQGDAYSGNHHQYVDNYWLPAEPLPQRARDTVDAEGFNLLGRWSRQLTEKSSWHVQAYFDFTKRDDLYLKQKQQTFDIDVQHRWQPAGRHDLIWGIGYRTIKDDFGSTYQYAIEPDKRTQDLWSAFLQDEIALVEDRLGLTIGVKTEKNDYTGYEIQPNLRLLWQPTDSHSLWTSVARAARTPSRAEDSGQITLANLPLPPAYPKITIDGNPDMKAEELTAYEAGYRFASSATFSFDLAAFYHDYKNLQSFQQATPTAPILFVNGLEGYSYGLEISTEWRPRRWLSTQLSYSFFDCRLKETIVTVADNLSVKQVAENSTPQHQVSIHSGVRFSDALRANIWLRYVDALETASFQTLVGDKSVPSYTAVDANLIWRPGENIEFMLAGQNLFDPEHLEFISENFIAPVEIGRSIYLKVTANF